MWQGRTCPGAEWAPWFSRWAGSEYRELTYPSPDIQLIGRTGDHKTKKIIIVRSIGSPDQHCKCCPNSCYSYNSHQGVSHYGLRVCLLKELHKSILWTQMIQIQLAGEAVLKVPWTRSTMTPLCNQRPLCPGPVDFMSHAKLTQALFLMSQSFFSLSRYVDISWATASTHSSLPFCFW